MINRFREKIKLGNFSKNILTLVSGTTVAQIIPIAVAPILTRIYTPEDFGLLALYLGLANIITNIATGRYELAILLPKKDDKSRSVVALSVLISFSLSILFLLIVIFFKNRIATLLGNQRLEKWLYFIPLSILINGLYQSHYYWLNRNGGYKEMAYSKVIRNSATAIFGIILNLFSMGLLYAQVLGHLFSTVYLSIFSKNKYPIKFIQQKNHIKKVAFEYRRFPIYDIPTALISSSSQNIPNILFNSFFSAVTGGFYYLANRIIGLPVNVISRAFLDVFKQQAAEEFINEGNAKRTFLKTIRIMVILSVIPFALFYVFSENIFAFAFGEEWSKAGEYAKILIPMIFFKFLASPLSFMFYIASKQAYNLFGQATILLILFTAFLIGRYYDSEYLTLKIIAVSFSIFYITYILISYKLALNVKPKISK